MAKGIIGIVGSGLEDPEINSIALEVGALIAGEGKILVNGGLGGVMRASAKGCKERGGVTVGILPGKDPREANPYIDIPIATGLGEMRNMLIVRASGALIAIGGGWGTLSEIALARKISRTVIGINTWDVSSEIIKVNKPAEAIEKALEVIGV